MMQLAELATVAGGRPAAVAVAIAMGALGIWMMLPPRGRALQYAGRVLGGVGLIVLLACLPRVGGWVEQGLFWVLAAVALCGAAATITMRSPVYSAVWFAVTLLGVSGLVLLAGAQFLAVATIIVYAGAIVVTFLFVLMLAQPEGHTYYDRISWGRLAAVAGVLCGGVVACGATLFVLLLGPVGRSLPESQRVGAGPLDHPQHVAQLGAELFSRHLVSVEVAGTLLLVALVGAIAMALASRGIAPAKGQPEGGRVDG